MSHLHYFIVTRMSRKRGREPKEEPAQIEFLLDHEKEPFLKIINKVETCISIAEMNRLL